MQETIIIQTNFIHFYVLIFFLILGISFYIVALETKNLNKTNFLSLKESKQQTVRKHVEKEIKKYGYKMHPAQ
jgi:hypothetical protein